MFLMKGGDFMKRILAIIVSLVFVLSVAGLSFAKEKKHAAKEMHVTGQVTAVDDAAKTLTVSSKKGEVTLMIDDMTKFHKGKTLSDVQVGDKVTAKYSDMDGKMMASRVKINHSSMKKEMKEEKKE
jgi:acylphosphatase